MWPFGRILGLIIIALALFCDLAGVVAVQAQPPGDRSSDDDNGDRGGRRRGGRRGGFQLSPEMIERWQEMRRQYPEGGRPGERGGNDQSTGQEVGQRSDDSTPKSEESKETEFPAIERPTIPPRVPDPRDLDVNLDERGRVPPFAFVGQPWTDVLQWLANLYDYSLDWQEMPGDYLNLVSEDSKTLDEVRDLVNRQLLARGFTTLVEKEVLSVFRIRKVEPSLVQRITEDELYDLKPYELAKVSFELPDGMQLDTAAEDVKTVLSPSARVFPLHSTRRLLVMDVVANLRNISALFNEERNVAGMPREFPLRYARGEKVIETLYVILGINPEQRPEQRDIRVQRQRWEAIEEMVERDRDVRGLLESPKVFLAYNPQRNSVLANAPPEQMRVIAQTIRSLDVPAGGDAGFYSGGPVDAGRETAGIPGSGRYLDTYQLVTSDPDRMIVTLEEVGNLSPWTELRSDPTSKTLFVQASAQDHEKLKRLISELDAAGRTFHVIPLRRLPADQVAVTIQQMLVRSATPEQNQDSDRGGRRGRRGGRGDFFRRMFQQQDDSYDPTEGFRVSADLEHNRLLLWANTEEVTEVSNLLAQLGESKTGTFDDKFRVIDVERDAAGDILDKLRRAWAGDNQLIIDDIESRDDPSSEDVGQPARAEQAPADRSAQHSTSDPLTIAQAPATHGGHASVRPSRPTALFVQYSQVSESDNHESAAPPAQRDEAPPSVDAPQPQDDEPSADSAPFEDVATGEKRDAAPPVRLTRTPDGKLLVTSEDPEAVRRVEELIRILGPKKSPFEEFPITHVSALSVWLQLTEYFQDELADSSGQQGGGFFGGSSSSSVPMTGLAERRNLRILYDQDTNVVLVANATPSQVFEINELIRVFDKPKGLDAFRTRRTAIIPLRYSKAATVAATIKDVYRDLLSSRDREFQSGNNRQQGAIRTIAEDTVIHYGSATDGQQKQTAPIDVGFDGALSVGVDEVANAVVISAEEPIFDAVVDMARELDDGAHVDTRIVVHRIDNAVNAQALHAALSSLVGAANPESKTSSIAQSGSENSNGRNRGQQGQSDLGQFRGRQFSQGQFGGSQFGGERFGRGQRTDSGDRGNARSQRGQGGRGQASDGDRGRAQQRGGRGQQSGGRGRGQRGGD